MKILEESTNKYEIFVLNKKTSNIYEIPFNLNTEKLILKIKTFVKKYDKNDLMFEIKYYKKGVEITENFDSVFQLIYRIKTI